MNFDIPKKNRPMIHEIEYFDFPSSRKHKFNPSECAHCLESIGVLSIEDMKKYLKKQDTEAWQGIVIEVLKFGVVLAFVLLVGFILYAN